MAIDGGLGSGERKKVSRERVKKHKFERFEGTQSVVGVCNVTKGEQRGKEFTLNGIYGDADCPHCGAHINAQDIGTRKSKARRREEAAKKKAAKKKGDDEEK